MLRLTVFVAFALGEDEFLEGGRGAGGTKVLFNALVRLGDEFGVGHGPGAWYVLFGDCHELDEGWVVLDGAHGRDENDIAAGA